MAKLDRIAPSMAAAAAAIRRVDEAGGRLVSVEEKFDTGTPTGKFALHMILALAQLEVDRIRDTWARAQESAVNRGVHIASRLPTGYRRGADGRLEPVESAAPTIADMFRRRAAGASWKELAGILEGAGIVGPYGGTAWTTGAVRNVIENPVYTGQARSGQHHKDGAHPALVSEAEWRAAQLTRRTVSPLRSPSGALLAGLLRCAGCRYVMKPDTITSREGNLRQYRCRGEHAAGRCPAPTSVLAHVVEPRVVAAFFAELGPDGVLTRPAADRAATEHARHALAETEAELAAWIEAVSVREVGRDAYAAGLTSRRQSKRPRSRRWTPPWPGRPRPVSRSPPGCPRSGPTSRHRIDGSSSRWNRRDHAPPRPRHRNPHPHPVGRRGARRPSGSRPPRPSRLVRVARARRLELSRRPEQGGQDDRRQSDGEADDPPRNILAHEDGAQEGGDPDDSTGGDDAHEATLDHAAASLAARQHALRALVPARLGRRRVGRSYLRGGCRQFVGRGAVVWEFRHGRTIPNR